MPGKVIVGCKLPHGLVISHPNAPEKKAVIQGLNKSIIKGASHVMTHVDADLWEAWASTHKDFPALKSKAIFVAKTQDEADGKSKDLSKVKTGLEPMPQEALGVKKDDGK
jgi:hypothetical protein